VELPVTFPQTAQTMGISRVACLAAVAAGVNQGTMISTLSRTSSADQLGKAAHLSFVRSEFKSDVLPLDVAEIF
jgi:hypothetical protein